MISWASRLWWHRYLARNARPWTDLDAFPALDPAKQRRELASRLMAQVRYFGSRADALPEWKEAARITDPDELWRVWTGLPVLTKQTLRERFPAAEIRDRFAIQGRINASGGSTGEPTQFFHDTLTLKTAVAGNTYTRLRMGWRPGMATIIVWGSERDIGRQTAGQRVRTLLWLLQECLVDGYHLSQATVDRVLELIRAKQPVAIYGFTSMLEFVARAVLDRGNAPPAGSVRTAWNGGEMLFPEQARVFEQAFGVPLLNRYGGRELSTMACQFQAGGPLELLRPWLFLEVLDDNGKPAEPGAMGRLVWTSTVCRGTPFLRYDIEDLGVFDAAHQTEAGIGALRELCGRRAGLMKLADGRVISNLYWNHLFKEFPEVRQFQVVYKTSGEIWISLVGEGMPEPREAQLREKLRHLIAEIPVRLLWTDRIARNAQGKLIQVVREQDASAG
ncbi:MAG: AMP-binding protein [Bryobacteraceae bacterium]|jgi:phenylacetate-CoA ligase